MGSPSRKKIIGLLIRPQINRQVPHADDIFVDHLAVLLYGIDDGLVFLLLHYPDRIEIYKHRQSDWYYGYAAKVHKISPDKEVLPISFHAPTFPAFNSKSPPL